MDADFELQEDGSIKPTAPPVFKRGRGRPKGWSQAKNTAAKKGLDVDGNPLPKREGEEDVNDLSMRKARAVADKAEADAKLAWLKFKVDSKEYLSRTAFREVNATVLSQIAQSMRSLPDTLERKHGLSPEVVMKVEETINAVLADAAEALEMFVEVTPMSGDRE